MDAPLCEQVLVSLRVRKSVGEEQWWCALKNVMLNGLKLHPNVSVYDDVTRILIFCFVSFKQMVMSLRVSELQVLLGYAGRNKHGRKHELLTKALHLLKAGCSPAVQMKIKELYRRRFPQKIMTPADLSIPSVHSSSMPAALSPSTIPQLSYDGHPATSPLLPVSLLGPKHELELPHLTSALHPVHPDIKLQKLPFYDLLDELIKPTSLGKVANNI